MKSFVFSSSFSGLQMIVKSQLVCLEKDKVCWKSYKYQLLLITLGHSDTMRKHTHMRAHTHSHVSITAGGITLASFCFENVP